MRNLTNNTAKRLNSINLIQPLISGRQRRWFYPPQLCDCLAVTVARETWQLDQDSEFTKLLRFNSIDAGTRLLQFPNPIHTVEHYPLKLLQLYITLLHSDNGSY